MSRAHASSQAVRSPRASGSPPIWIGCPYHFRRRESRGIVLAFLFVITAVNPNLLRTCVAQVPSSPPTAFSGFSTQNQQFAQPAQVSLVTGAQQAAWDAPQVSPGSGISPWPADTSYFGPGAVAEVRRLEDVEILAQVGNSWILASDVRPGVAEILEERAANVPPDQRATIERMATVRILDQLVETRMLYLAAKHRVPSERMTEMEKRLGEYFDTDELPRRLKEGKYTSVEQYQQKLESLGGSLEHERRLFIEPRHRLPVVASRDRHGARSGSYGALGVLPCPSRGIYHSCSRARWEEVWVNIPRYSDGKEAWAKLAAVGNMLLSGMSLEQALEQQPREEPRCFGQRRDWTTQGSLLAEPQLEAVVFNLSVGYWSQIFRVANRFYIVRVLERQEATVTPFPEAQNAIREKSSRNDASKRFATT